MKYLPLMRLQLTHPYYADGRCPDFVIEPAPATQGLLKNHRCVLKPFPSGVRVLTAVGADDSQFIPLPAGATFAFRLRLRNPGFALFTDLTEINQSLAPRYTNVEANADNPASLALSSRPAWSTERCVVRQPGLEERFTLGGRPLAGALLTDFTLGGGNAITVAHYDGAARIITVNSAGAGAGTSFEITYPTTPLRVRDVLAEVEIHYDHTWPDLVDGPKEYQIAFNPKQARWAYYLITDRSEARFGMEDRAASPLRFSDENRTDLSRQPDPADEIARTLAAQYPTMQRWRFVSDEPVPCRQAARESIQLRLDDHPVLETLPNPSLKNYAIIEVSSNGNVDKEEALFQVIKYFNHQFLTTGG